jgi:hypothetical protein
MSVTNFPRIFGVPALSPVQFNSQAGALHLPFTLASGIADPAHITPDQVLFADPAQRDVYIRNGQFTPAFETAYHDLAESQRQESVQKSLNEGRAVIVETDLSGLPVEEKRMVRHLHVVAQLVEKLYMKQEGSWQYVDGINARKASDPVSYSLFWRNQKPWADAPQTASDPFANALPSFPKQNAYGVYPEGISADDKDFFEQLRGDKQLSSPWTAVVRAPDGTLKAVPYHEYFSEDMRAIASELDLAADAIAGLADEKALYEYLRATAEAFRTGDWDAADVKWCAMTMQNSKYAIRVAPDETYWEPGNMKSGFQFWFARIDEKAATLTRAVKPYVQEMENEFENLVPLYKARKLDKLDIPDFIEMVMRSGDHKSSLGATIGEKLPNFNDQVSRGVVMTNYYSDPKSKEVAVQKAHDLLVPAIADAFTPDKEVATANTFLHELTHSLAVQGANFITRNADGTARKNAKGDPLTTQEALGGANAQVMEELKAQTSDLYWIGWLKDKGVFSEDLARKLYTDAVIWAFGHISRGMLQGDGTPRTYSQLAAIQIRALINDGAITIEDGKFNLHYEKFHATAKKLLTETHRIQVMGDEAAASALRRDIVDGPGYAAIRAKEVYDLLQKYPTASFDLRIRMDGEVFGDGADR